jgi:UDP-N-acetyl-D-galactosamine dehydrogenase
VAVVGLGYVGLPLAVALQRSSDVIGLDVDAKRIAELKAGHDRTGEIDADRLAACGMTLTATPDDARGCEVYVVTVPTPVDANNQPDLSIVMAATRTVAALLDGANKPLIIYESTVYPGVTEEMCGPEIERISGLVSGVDFFLGYSPERINPGDREHTVDKIMKVVSGQTPEALERVADLYAPVTSGGVFRAASIKVAEAAKVIENAQRDINIAFMNEIASIFAPLDMSVWDVLAAANTKWNFLPFRPGLVGGHCIGVDPYYLAFRAQQLGYDPQVILAGRGTNDAMAAWVARQIDAANVGANGGARGKALVLGLTFKEDVPDLRNSKVVDMITALNGLGYNVSVTDPLADAAEALHEYDITLTEGLDTGETYDVVILAVPHSDYRALDAGRIKKLLSGDGLFADLGNSVAPRLADSGLRIWTL